MENNKNKEALEFLQNLIGLPLYYGIKSPDMDLYDFGFGNLVELPDFRGGKREVCEYALHATCRFKIIQKTGEQRIALYHEDTPCEEFHEDIKSLIGLRVKKATLWRENDLWLDFGDYLIGFFTFKDGEESWRLFTPGDDGIHLVASDTCIEFH